MSTIPTPYLPDSSLCDWDAVYEPAEDTFLLLDALEEDFDFITEKKPLICLEVGSGSGIVISAIASALSPNATCIAVDINEAACLLTKNTANRNSVKVEVLNADLTKCLRNNTLDLVLFNPPYVVTPTDEIEQKGVSKAWAGGLDGREVIDQFIEEIVPKLSNTGFGYLLLLHENNPVDIIATLQGHGCRCLEIKRRQLRGELLCVIRFEKI